MVLWLLFAAARLVYSMSVSVLFCLCPSGVVRLPPGFFISVRATSLASSLCLGLLRCSSPCRMWVFGFCPFPAPLARLWFFSFPFMMVAFATDAGPALIRERERIVSLFRACASLTARHFQTWLLTRTVVASAFTVFRFFFWLFGHG